MVAELSRQADKRGIQLRLLKPCLNTAGTDETLDDLVINWRHLGSVSGSYDYVLCRGNSLAYADSWSGRAHASSRATIREHLTHIAAKVDAGGHLHVDAAWILAPEDGPRVVIDTPKLTITEEIKDHHDHRKWILHFFERDDDGNEEEIRFRRFSSRLTIHDVADELRALGSFDQIEPVQMEAERLVYGTIIARKTG